MPVASLGGLPVRYQNWSGLGHTTAVGCQWHHSAGYRCDTRTAVVWATPLRWDASGSTRRVTGALPELEWCGPHHCVVMPVASPSGFLVPVPELEVVWATPLRWDASGSTRRATGPVPELEVVWGTPLCSDASSITRRVAGAGDEAGEWCGPCHLEVVSRAPYIRLSAPAARLVAVVDRNAAWWLQWNHST